ncbi:MAG: BlaI/MecI/CopY family transcriptional regulator [Acidimicrobiales bacterium]
MRGNRSARRAHGELETGVMAAVAAAAVPVTVHEVGQTVDAELSHTAVHTILNRLVDKGLLERDKTGRRHVYRPAANAATVVAHQMDALLHRGPSRAAVLRSFLSALGEEDERYLREWLGIRPDSDR